MKVGCYKRKENKYIFLHWSTQPPDGYNTMKNSNVLKNKILLLTPNVLASNALSIKKQTTLNE